MQADSTLLTYAIGASAAVVFEAGGTLFMIRQLAERVRRLEKASESDKRLQVTEESRLTKIETRLEATEKTGREVLNKVESIGTQITTALADLAWLKGQGGTRGR